MENKMIYRPLITTPFKHNVTYNEIEPCNSLLCVDGLYLFRGLFRWKRKRSDERYSFVSGGVRDQSAIKGEFYKQQADGKVVL